MNDSRSRNVADLRSWFVEQWLTEEGLVWLVMEKRPLQFAPHMSETVCVGTGASPIQATAILNRYLNAKKMTAPALNPPIKQDGNLTVWSLCQRLKAAEATIASQTEAMATMTEAHNLRLDQLQTALDRAVERAWQFD